MELKYKGIIIGKKDIQEVDRLYFIYTLEQGRIMIAGKGVRKAQAKLAGNLETLTYAEVYASKGRGRGNITGAIALNNFLSLKADFEATSRVFYAISYFEKFITQEEKDERAFELLLEYLETMDALASSKSFESKHDAVTFGFLFKFLSNSGYGAEVNRCVACGGNILAGKNRFSAKRGGIVCADCQKGDGGSLAISDTSIKLMRIFYKNKIGNLSKLNVDRKDIGNLKVVFQEFANWIR